MAYNVAANLRQTRPGAAFLEARDNVARNALAERQVAGSEQAQQFNQQNALFNQQRLAAADKTAAAELSKEQEKQMLTQSYAQAQRILAAPPGQRRAVADALFDDEDRAELASQGIDYNTLDDDGIAQVASKLENQIGAALGIGPADQYEQVTGPRGAVMKRNKRTGEISQVVGPDNTESPNYGRGGFRTLSPIEIEAAGLPPGTSAQEGPDGKIVVISKRDNTAVLSQKDATTAKMKLNTVALARQQLAAIKRAFEGGVDPSTGTEEKGIKGTFSAGGGGQGFIATPSGKIFDSRVDQMRSTLTALTRVPGVGAMSDYETKLDQSKFPRRGAYESVTADTIKNLEDQLSLIENGYKTLLEGGSTAQGSTPAAPPKETAAQRAARLGL
jgi:hypothetical protein